MTEKKNRSGIRVWSLEIDTFTCWNLIYDKKRIWITDGRMESIMK